jgi:hypothetical protein
MRDDLIQVRCPAVCVYVLRDEEGLHLIDGGFVFGIRLVEQALRRRGWDQVPLRSILITHGHLAVRSWLPPLMRPGICGPIVTRGLLVCVVRWNRRGVLYLVAPRFARIECWRTERICQSGAACARFICRAIRKDTWDSTVRSMNCSFAEISSLVFPSYRMCRREFSIVARNSSGEVSARLSISNSLALPRSTAIAHRGKRT